MYIMDEPAISLKLTFDEMTPEFYIFIYLLTVLIVFSTIYIMLITLQFIVNQSFRMYKYISKKYIQFEEA